MSKKKNKNTVSIKRGGITKEISKVLWDQMKSTKSTYGWKLASDLSDEILNKDKQLEDSKISELEGKLKEASEKNETLSSEVAEKDSKMSELEGEIKAFEETVKNLELKVKGQADLLATHVKGTPAPDNKKAPAKTK